MVTRLVTSIALIGLTTQLTACLGAAQGVAPQQPDMASDDPGDNGPADPPPSSPPDLAGSVKIDAFTSSGTTDIAVSKQTATLRLNETQSFTVTVSQTGSSSGGTATLALVNGPAGLTATFNPPTVTVGATPVTSTMTVTAASSMDAATSVAAEVQANVNGVMSTTTFGVTVQPILLVSIAAGVATTNNPTAFGATSISVKQIAAGVQVAFVNNDTINHEIHADGTGGIPHEGGPLDANGGIYDTNPGTTTPLTITPGFTGPINFRCHIHGGMAGQLMVTN